MTIKERKAIMNDIDEALGHLHIMQVWAAVGINYDGIEPKCCESVTKWCSEVERVFLKLQNLAEL